MQENVEALGRIGTDQQILWSGTMEDRRQASTDRLRLQSMAGYMRAYRHVRCIERMDEGAPEYPMVDDIEVQEALLDWTYPPNDIPMSLGSISPSRTSVSHGTFEYNWDTD